MLSGKKHIQNRQVVRYSEDYRVRREIIEITAEKFQRFHDNFCVSKAVLVCEDLKDSYEKWSKHFPASSIAISNSFGFNRDGITPR